MTVKELRDALAELDDNREIEVTWNYSTGQASKIVSIGDEGEESVYLFPDFDLEGQAA